MQAILQDFLARALASSTVSRASSATHPPRRRPFLSLQPLPALQRRRRQFCTASSYHLIDYSSNSQRRERPLNYHNGRAAAKPKTSSPKTSSSGGGSSFSQNLENAGNIFGGIDSGIGIVNVIKSLFDSPAAATVTTPAASAATSSSTPAYVMNLLSRCHFH